MSYPLRLEPRPVERVWGGRSLARLFGRAHPDAPIGESWEVFGELPVIDGPFAGRTLDELTRSLGPRLVGTEVDASRGFPLLTKWLDCRDWLSVQVHPDDAVARRLTGDPGARGKTECWYFHEVEDGAEVIHGLADGVDAEKVAAASGAEVLDMVRRLQPRPGSFLHTPAGTVHALGPGMVLYEIQQSSDLTYRLHDWERPGLDGHPRELHPQEASAAIRDSRPPEVAGSPRVGPGELVVHSAFFVVERLKSSAGWRVGPASFEILTMVQGRSAVAGMANPVPLGVGDSCLLPADMGRVELHLEQGAVCLRIRVPGLGGRET